TSKTKPWIIGCLYRQRQIYLHNSTVRLSLGDRSAQLFQRFLLGPPGSDYIRQRERARSVVIIWMLGYQHFVRHRNIPFDGPALWLELYPIRSRTTSFAIRLTQA